MSNFEQWHIEYGEDSDYIYVGPYYSHIDVVNPVVSLHDEKSANLIAAAPELADSTKWLLDAVHALLSSKPVRDMDERISFAESALRKARGE